MRSVLTYWAEIEPLLEPDHYRKVYDGMPAWRREKADRIRFLKDRALSVGAWRLYMLALQEAGAEEGLPYNLSHSGGYVMVSIAPEGEQVGCDVEMIKEGREPLARRFFCRGEYDWMAGQTEAGRREAFYRLWVLKESFMKATRYGMKLGLDSFEFDMAKTEGPFLKRQPEFVKGRYFFQEFTAPAGDAAMAVCSTCDQFSRPVKIELI